MRDDYTFASHLVEVIFVELGGREYPVRDVLEFLDEVYRFDAENNPMGKDQHLTEWLVRNYVIHSDDHGWQWFADDNFDAFVESLKQK